MGGQKMEFWGVWWFAFVVEYYTSWQNLDAETKRIVLILSAMAGYFKINPLQSK